MRRGMLSHGIAVVFALAMLLTTFAWGGTALAAPAAPGAVYVLTNAVGGNAVAVFDRAADGTLTPVGTVATGGLGTDGGLGSQGALVLSKNNRWLFAVNAGSDDISIFDVSQAGPRLVDRVGSGGVRPISLTVHGDLLYVLNAGGNGNITGFHVGADGTLTPLAGSTRPLSSSAAGPAQVQFSPDGDLLVVTEKATNTIDTYIVGADGIASGPAAQPSAGSTPFGFAFDTRGRLIVSEAFGGAPGAGAVSSYSVDAQGALAAISPSAPDHQGAPCWLVVTKNGRYAYTTNAASGSISGYGIAPDGSLTLLDADGVTGDTGAGSKPIDLDLSQNSHYLYALTAGNGSIAAFEVHSDGSLTSLPGAGGLPASAVGMAAR